MDKQWSNWAPDVKNPPLNLKRTLEKPSATNSSHCKAMLQRQRPVTNQLSKLIRIPPFRTSKNCAVYPAAPRFPLEVSLRARWGARSGISQLTPRGGADFRLSFPDASWARRLGHPMQWAHYDSLWGPDLLPYLLFG